MIRIKNLQLSRLGLDQNSAYHLSTNAAQVIAKHDKIEDKGSQLIKILSKVKKLSKILNKTSKA